MGLDAWVCCNCIKQGLAPPHPFPEFLAFDETAEPILRSDAQIRLEQWLMLDSWYNNSCPHSGRLIARRLGNMALISQVRNLVESLGRERFPLILERVVYDGTHSGDWIAAGDSVRLLEEAQRLRQALKDGATQQFASGLIELAEASLATGNPIVF